MDMAIAEARTEAVPARSATLDPGANSVGGIRECCIAEVLAADLLCTTMRGSAAVKITGLPKTITSVHFRLRASHYGLAISDTPRDAAMFRDLAWTFERLSKRFARAETRRHSL